MGIQIELTWEGKADLDLHVTDPYGETIYYFRPSSRSGGAYQEDRECHNNNGQPERIEYNTAVPLQETIKFQFIISDHAVKREMRDGI